VLQAAVTPVSSQCLRTTSTHAMNSKVVLLVIHMDFCPRHLTCMVKCITICSYLKMGTERVPVITQMKMKITRSFFFCFVLGVCISERASIRLEHSISLSKVKTIKFLIQKSFLMMRLRNQITKLD
jgi:hypothetical protein